MAAKHILRVRRTDVDEATPAYALLAVEPAGPEPLDVKLVGTEGESVFAASVRGAQIRNFRDRRSKTGDDHEWESILRSSLLLRPTAGDDAKLLENVEIVASVSDQHLNLTVRKNIQGITQRLGVIPLAEDCDTEIEFFEWTAIAVETASAARDGACELRNKHEAQQVTINKLKSQLDELIQSKNDHEKALLAKFQDLLNAKKLKIRDQQRLLAGAKVDPAVAAAVDQARDTKRDTRPRKAGPSRASKRKATMETPVIDSESELDRPSRMDVDDDDAAAKLEGDEEIAEPATPEGSDSDLETTEDEDDDDLDAIPAAGPAEAGPGSRDKATETATQSQSSQRQKSPEAPPPRRELPFIRDQGGQPRNGIVKKTPARAVQDDDETTTTDDDDDEL
ncbi:dna double-strand break repair and vj recombination xrcc4 [Diplodia corticola]|uniref:Dna double-strand break repair and vj recombination xrcc4 n=1 Tax=Diplodia corticola TaxID=236234 RepID=A0A1J9RNB0_9PEZI|nr:dna double-strand break repair and vj recombination xrcc4 [Diplodia corticola]OJD29085.1 dna double-strand break repair and vj recombination xrcc4 [Diplodia corticola]